MQNVLYSTWLKVVPRCVGGTFTKRVLTHQISDVGYLDQFLFIIDVVLRLATPLCFRKYIKTDGFSRFAEVWEGVGPKTSLVSSNGHWSSVNFYGILGFCRWVWLGFSSKMTRIEDQLSGYNFKSKGLVQKRLHRFLVIWGCSVVGEFGGCGPIQWVGIAHQSANKTRPSLAVSIKDIGNFPLDLGMSACRASLWLQLD